MDTGNAAVFYFESLGAQIGNQIIKAVGTFDQMYRIPRHGFGHGWNRDWTELSHG